MRGPRRADVQNRGLTSVAAVERLARDGPNVLPTAKHTPAWVRLAAQMTHFFAVMLWAAGVLAFVAGMPQLGVAIFVVVVVNGAFAFVQEHRAERAVDRLRDCLDIGTDLLPALALGAEPAEPGVLRKRPNQGHLIDAPLLRRVFGVLGPVEAAVEMTAFLVALVAAGWRPGDGFPTGHALLAASGAAFAAVVIGQFANAFACRSTTRPPWRLGWTTNRLLVGAVAVELFLLLGFLGLPFVARTLDHAIPPWAGALVAVLAFPAVLAADAVHKRTLARRSGPRQVQKGRRPMPGPAVARARWTGLMRQTTRPAIRPEQRPKSRTGRGLCP